MQFTVTPRGFAEFEKALTAAPQVASSELAKAARKSAYLAQNSIRQFAPMKTGAGRRSIKGSASGPRARVFSNLTYMRFVNDGTAAHGPKKAKAMVFTYHGRKVFAKWVAGIQPRRFFERGLAYSKQRIEKYYDEAITAILSSLAK